MADPTTPQIMNDHTAESNGSKESNASRQERALRVGPKSTFGRYALATCTITEVLILLLAWSRILKAGAKLDHPWGPSLVKTAFAVLVVIFTGLHTMLTRKYSQIVHSICETGRLDGRFQGPMIMMNVAMGNFFILNSASQCLGALTGAREATRPLVGALEQIPGLPGYVRIGGAIALSALLRIVSHLVPSHDAGTSYSIGAFAIMNAMVYVTFVGAGILPILSWKIAKVVLMRFG